MAEKITISAPFSQESRSLGRIGRVGENLSRQIVFDCTSALTDRPNATIVCVIQRTGDKEPYAAQMTRVGDTGSYKLVLTSTEVAKSGSVRFELRMVDGEEILKAAIYTGTVEASMSGIGDMPGEPIPDALNRLETAISEVGKYADLKEKVDALSDVGLSAAGAAVNQVPTADGAGSWSWKDQQGGAGSSGEVDTTLTESGKAADAKVTGDRINALEDNQITAEDPAESAEVQSTLESILKSIADKGNNILAQIQQNGGKGLTVYCWGDSLTQGIGGNVNGWHLISYPQVLAERCNAVNLGILSDNVPTIMARMGADAILLPACTIPASSSESVVVGNTTNGMSLESGRTAHLLKYGDCGINPCYVNDVPCVLFRDYTSDTTDGQNIRIRRLEDGDALTVAADTKLTTYGAKHYKGNGLHIFWMGANGGYGSDAQHSNLDFSDYVEQLQKCVDYVSPADYLIVYARERKGYAQNEAEEIAVLKETFAGHLIDLLPQLCDRGLLYAETSQWDGTKKNGVPTVLDSGDGCHYSFYGYMAIGKIIWEYVAPRVLNKTTSSGGTDTPDTPVTPVVDSDEIGKWAYKLKSPKNLISGSLAINTGFKPFAEGATTWTIAVKFADGLTAADATQWGTLMFCEVETSKTQLKIATLDSGTQYPECNVMCNSGGFAISTEQMGLTLYDSGYHTFVITKNDGDYTFYLDNTKLYNNKLGYPQAGNGDDPLYIGGWGSGWGMVKGTIMDVRIYNQCIDDAAVDTLNSIFAEA